MSDVFEHDGYWSVFHEDGIHLLETIEIEVFHFAGRLEQDMTQYNFTINCVIVFSFLLWDYIEDVLTWPICSLQKHRQCFHRLTTKRPAKKFNCCFLQNQEKNFR